jgi:nitronate monooxygenase
MASASPPSLAAAVANAGGMGALGALVTSPQGIREWASDFRSQSNGSFQLNVWIPDPPPVRNAEVEKRMREFLAGWGPPVAPEAGDARMPDFDKQCEAFLEVAPPVVSSIMGLFPQQFVRECKRRKIAWFCCVTTVREAQEAREAGADAIVVQGMRQAGIAARSRRATPRARAVPFSPCFPASPIRLQMSLSSRPVASQTDAEWRLLSSLELVPFR